MNEQMPSLNAGDNKRERIAYKGRYITALKWLTLFFFIAIAEAAFIVGRWQENKALRAGFNPELGTVTIRPSVLERR